MPEHNVMKYKVFSFKDLYIDSPSKLLESVVKKETLARTFSWKLSINIYHHLSLR